LPLQSGAAALNIGHADIGCAIKALSLNALQSPGRKRVTRRRLCGHKIQVKEGKLPGAQVDLDALLAIRAVLLAVACP
jgi:hypothetical protein